MGCHARDSCRPHLAESIRSVGRLTWRSSRSWRWPTYLAGTTSLLLLLVFFTVNLSLLMIKRREREPIRTFCAPIAIPVLGTLTCLALMPFVPRGSLLTAGVILVLGAGLVGLRTRRSKA
jgi:amino acid transporter